MNKRCRAGGGERQYAAQHRAKVSDTTLQYGLPMTPLELSKRTPLLPCAALSTSHSPLVSGIGANCPLPPHALAILPPPDLLHPAYPTPSTPPPSSPTPSDPPPLSPFADGDYCRVPLRCRSTRPRSPPRSFAFGFGRFGLVPTFPLAQTSCTEARICGCSSSCSVAVSLRDWFNVQPQTPTPPTRLAAQPL